MSYYDELGVPRTATLAEIRRAYRAQARRLHPDVNSSRDAEIRFRRLHAAYVTLRNPRHRAEYDEMLHEAEVRQRAVESRALVPTRDIMRCEPWLNDPPDPVDLNAGAVFVLVPVLVLLVFVLLSAME